MQKRGLFFVLSFFLVILMFSFVVADDSETCESYCMDNFFSVSMPSCSDAGKVVSGNYPDCECEWVCGDDCGEFDCDELELTDPGTTPDSALYFLDEFFDRFGDELEVKEEKVAEIKAMIEAGDFDSARKALERYKVQAEHLKHEIDPEKAEEAKKSAMAIKKALKEVEKDLSEKDKSEFYDGVIKDEEGVVTAAEISGKIKELCQVLSELDPLEYSKMCKTDDDAPRWQRKLDRELTGEQEEEAKKFGKIMKQCFETSGQECRCDEIPFTDFAEHCLVAAPLATACDIKQDENACMKLESLEMPRLPDHLQDVFDDLEEDVVMSRIEMHMPKECREAGVKSPKECGRIMIQTHAPEECKEALLASGCEKESECREICDEIMMEKHAPECAKEGITDPDECAGFMDSFRKDDMGPGGPRIDFDCKKIKDPMERLDCYDKASSQASSYKGFDDEDYEGPCMTEKDWQDKKKECREKYGEHAGDEPIMGDSGKGYECAIDAKCIDFGYKDDYDAPEDCKAVGALSREACEKHRGDVADLGPGCDDCASQCEDKPGKRLHGTDCVNDRCECYYEDVEEEQDSEPETSPEPEAPAPEPSSESEEEKESEPEQEPEPSEGDVGNEGDNTGGEGITGEVIGNRFLKYYY